MQKNNKNTFKRRTFTQKEMEADKWKLEFICKMKKRGVHEVRYEDKWRTISFTFDNRDDIRESGRNKIHAINKALVFLSSYQTWGIELSEREKLEYYEEVVNYVLEHGKVIE